MSDSLPLDDLAGRPATRIAGDFRRHPHNGAPYVLDPSGATTKAGKPTSLLYGRPSGLHRWIEDGFALERWSERMVLRGSQLLGIEEIEAVEEALETDSDAILDRVVARAKHLAGADLAAARGTAAHEATHRLHDLQHAERDVIENLAEIGFPPALEAAVLDVYERSLDRFGLEVLASEIRLVDDAWRVAGTADRIVRLLRPLTFGELTVEAGTVVVADLKTGNLRVKSGEPLYWNGYAVQIASYAQSVGYVIDGDDEHREPLPWPIDQGVGLVLHIDIAGALETDVVTASLWGVDLDAGRLGGRLAVAARDWSKTRGLFAPLVGDYVAKTVEAESQLEADLAASLNLRRRAWLQERIDTLGRHSRQAQIDLVGEWPLGVPGLRSSEDHDEAALSAIEAVLGRVEARHGIPFGASRPDAPAARPSWLVAAIGAFPGTTIETTEDS